MNMDSRAKDIATLKRLAELPILRGESARVSVDQYQLARVVMLATQGLSALVIASAAEEFLAAYEESYVEGGPANLVSLEDRLVAALESFRKQGEPEVASVEAATL